MDAREVEMQWMVKSKSRCQPNSGLRIDVFVQRSSQLRTVQFDLDLCTHPGLCDIFLRLRDSRE